MKKKKFLFGMLAFCLVAIMSVCITSCSNDDDDNGFSNDDIVGTWNLTDVEVDGKWYDVTSGVYSRFGATISFYSDGTYYGHGALGNGSGTWKRKGSTITTYVDGEVYIVYKVNSVNGNTMSGTMTQGSSTMNFKAKKK